MKDFQTRINTHMCSAYVSLLFIAIPLLYVALCCTTKEISGYEIAVACKHKIRIL